MHVTSSIHDGASAPAREPSLLDRYLSVRRTSMRLCSPLSIEDHSLQAMPDASPAKWHLAHTTWFFETFLLTPNLPRYKPLHPEFRNLFNSYYEAIGDRPLRSLRHTLSRPSLAEVHSYRAAVDEAMDDLLRSDPSTEALDLVVLGINHEQQHQELIVTDVKYGLWTNPLRPTYRESNVPQGLPRAGRGVRVSGLHADPGVSWRHFDGGVFDVGFDGDGFSFDNEGPRHQVYLQPFRLGSRLITNREYLEFMDRGAYSKPELWLSEGWDRVRAERWDAPLYWERRNGEWWHYTMEGMQPVDLKAPVCHVSYFEADAFARWAGARMATEFEWEVAAHDRPVEGNLLESDALEPRLAEPSDDLAQMFGDVWEWTGSAYLGYPEFKPAAGAVGEYNGKFMCNQMVLRGGSCATPQSHIRATYRNFFPPHVRWQFMGIRLANGD
jgi:ergothioneine biosynthesis protein EgtB